MPRPSPRTAAAAGAFTKRIIYSSERRDPKIVSLSVWGMVLATYTLAIHDFSQPILSALVANASSSLIGILSTSVVFGGNYKYARTLVSELTHTSKAEVGVRVHNIWGQKSSDVQTFLLKDFHFANEDNKLILFHVKPGNGKPDQRLFFRKNGEVEHFILDAIRPVPAKPLPSAIPKRSDIRHSRAS